MSATGRGPRLGGPEDFYESPKWTVDRFLEVYRPACTPQQGLIVEPGAGRGMIIRAAQPYLPGYRWLAVEVRGEERESLEATGAEVVIGDFLDEWLLQPRHDVGLVLGNPAYDEAFEILVRARELYPMAQVAFLMQLGFMASDKRWDFMYRHVPDVYVIPNRVSFYAGNGDSEGNAWMVWHPGERTRGDNYILASTPKEERSRKWLQRGPLLLPAQTSLFD